ncbi:MAG: glycosyltransferase [Deltaproteobacteria bacterium]
MGFRESYTDPLELYSIARDRGMTHVTITDHNTIDGCLCIAHLPDVMVSEEVTAVFPEDGCKIHVLVLDITESMHAEIQRLRENVYDLVQYLNMEGITHILAHALYPVNQRLTMEHVEKLLILFKNFEMNGARSALPNQTLELIFSELTPSFMAELSERHRITPLYPEPWRKTVTGGSDDHSSLNIARTYTTVPAGTTIADILAAIRRGDTRVVSRPPSPRTFAHNLYGIGWRYYKERFSLGNRVGKDVLLAWIEEVLRPEATGNSGLWKRLCRLYTQYRPARSTRHFDATSQGMFYDVAKKVVTGDRVLLSCLGGKIGQKEKEQALFRFACAVSNQVLGKATDFLSNNALSFNIFQIFQFLGSAGSLHTALSPYFVAYALFQQDRALCRKVIGHFIPQGPRSSLPCMKVAHFTDTFFDVNGVALTIQQQARIAKETGKPLTVITCGKESDPANAPYRNFTPISLLRLPEYPLQELAIPPFLEMLDYCYERGFTHFHLATPGPVGLAGLAIAKILGLPCFGTYHTAFPEYAGRLTADSDIEAGMWQFMLWFYRNMDAVFVPSCSTAEELAGHGVEQDRIQIYPRGVDTRRFHPSKRNGFYGRYGKEGGIKLLYVGRVSREKNLDILAEAYRRIHKEDPNVHLIIVGDGPYREELQASLAGTSALCTGVLRGEDLAAAYASADLFVFPSTTDTFGNVVLEAQASGLPVVVTDRGGPRENMIPEKTGVVVPGDDIEGMTHAIWALVTDETRRKAMGTAAFEYMRERSFEKAFERTWELYGRIRPVAVC